MSEADIRISGRPLDPGQSMAVRVACTFFLNDLMDGDPRDAVQSAYRARLTEVLALMERDGGAFDRPCPSPD